MDTAGEDLSLTLATGEVWSFVTPEEVSVGSLNCEGIINKAVRNKEAAKRDRMDENKGGMIAITFKSN